jgi:hypothetical protein
MHPNTNTQNVAIRQEIITRLGSPEPQLPGVEYIGIGTAATYELLQLFDEMCMMRDVGARWVIERAIAKLESVRERDYPAFYLGRSELLSMYPVVYEVPTGPEGETPPPAATRAPIWGSALVS